MQANIYYTYRTASDTNCEAVRVTVYEGCSIAPSLSCKKKTWSQSSNLEKNVAVPDNVHCNLLRDVIHKFISTLSMRIEVAAQQVIIFFFWTQLLNLYKCLYTAVTLGVVEHRRSNSGIRE